MCERVCFVLSSGSRERLPVRNTPQVKKIVAGSVAYRHGVKVGDILEAVGGRPAVYETRTG